jgi:murein DD-endopeptidase MepM/ murein hydrolase activator NlpD
MVFLPTQPPPTNNPILQGKQPWYTFPRIDNFGTIDPQPGTGWKPDSNIQIPGNYPITALLPGTVTSVQRTGFGQTVITVKLDNALNNLATHTFYEHMSSSTVSTGQHVSAGDLIGYNNPSGQVPLGFGLYGGDVYGSGPAYQTLQNDLAPGGANQLNPTNLLNQAKKGNLNINNPGGLTSSYNAPITSNCGLLDISCWATSIGEHIAIFVLGLVLIIVGLLLIGFKPVENAAQKVGKAAMLA